MFLYFSIQSSSIRQEGCVHPTYKKEETIKIHKAKRSYELKLQLVKVLNGTVKYLYLLKAILVLNYSSKSEHIGSLNILNTVMFRCGMHILHLLSSN